jgi:hypothetical protein
MVKNMSAAPSPYGGLLKIKGRNAASQSESPAAVTERQREDTDEQAPPEAPLTPPPATTFVEQSVIAPAPLAPDQAATAAPFPERISSQSVGLPETPNQPISVAQAKPVKVKPLAKRNDPAYQQVGTYIRVDTYNDVHNILRRERKEFADLVNELLSEWLAKRTDSRRQV